MKIEHNGKIFFFVEINDFVDWVDENNKSVSDSLFHVLRVKALSEGADPKLVANPRIIVGKIEKKAKAEKAMSTAVKVFKKDLKIEQKENI